MDIQAHRKDEHVFIAEKLYQSESRNRLDEVRLLFKNIPEISKNEISLTTTIMGYQVDSPFLLMQLPAAVRKLTSLIFSLPKWLTNATSPLRPVR